MPRPPPAMPQPALRTTALDHLTLEDEASFRHVGLYRDLKDRLLRDNYQVRVLAGPPRWDHALVLNLAFWDVRGGGDVLVDEVLPADVLCHMAWHHLAGQALGEVGHPLSAPALLLGEAIASAFDLYLIGRLLGHSPDSTFLETQVPAMADAAESAGVEPDAFAALMESVRADPEQAFEELRQLLYTVLTELLAATNADQALQALTRHDGARFGCLLHHYELANWLLHARAAPDNASADTATQVDLAMRAAPVALDWLAGQWLNQR